MHTHHLHQPPPPSPEEVQMQQMEMARMQAEIRKINAEAALMESDAQGKIVSTESKALLDQATAEEKKAKADKTILEHVEQEEGVAHERELDLIREKAALDIAKEKAKPESTANSSSK